MNLRHLLATFSAHRSQNSPLVLATVVRAAGSTYSKPGAMMLFSDNGTPDGLVSGGCLESDLGERARAVLASDTPALVTYDMRNEDEDALWGLGLGCNGMMEILLQPLRPDSGYAPFAAFVTAIEARSPGAVAQVVASGSDRGALGDLWLCEPDAAGSEGLLIRPIPRLAAIALLGTGPDALPLARFAEIMGWHIDAADHRPAYVERFERETGIATKLIRPDEVRAALPVDEADAVVIMSHHLATDLAYLNALAQSPVPWIGILGPKDRRQRLLEDLGGCAELLEHRLSGPVGLDLGGRGADSIALSIAAELEFVLNRAACAKPSATSRSAEPG